MTIGANKLVLAQVTGITPAHPAELADVQDEVRQQVQNIKLTKLVDESLAMLENRMKAGADFATLAKLAGATIKTSGLVERAGSIEGFGLASAAEEIFRKNPGEMAGPIRAGGSAFFMKLEAKTPADLTELASQREQLLTDLKNRRARDRRAVFIDGILQKLVKEKKVKIYEDNINRLVGTFRS